MDVLFYSFFFIALMAVVIALFWMRAGPQRATFSGRGRGRRQEPRPPAPR